MQKLTDDDAKACLEAVQAVLRDEIPVQGFWARVGWFVAGDRRLRLHGFWWRRAAALAVGLLLMGQIEAVMRRLDAHGPYDNVLVPFLIVVIAIVAVLSLIRNVWWYFTEPDRVIVRTLAMALTLAPEKLGQLTFLSNTVNRNNSVSHRLEKLWRARRPGNEG